VSVASTFANGSPGPAIPTTAIRGIATERLVQIIQGLMRREDAGRHAGPRFVHAVEPPVAEVALDIALRRHRQMNAAVLMPHGIVEAGMFGKIQFHDRPRTYIRYA
jgi:hypothetical protein